jgi:hypothetical protein
MRLKVWESTSTIDEPINGLPDVPFPSLFAKCLDSRPAVDEAAVAASVLIEAGAVHGSSQ